MATERNIFDDVHNFFVRDPLMSALEAQRMWIDILNNGNDEVRDTTPVLLIPGAGAQPYELLLTQLWYQRVGGFPNTHISRASTHGPMMSQIKELQEEIDDFEEPPHGVAISAGGSKAFVLACLNGERFKTLAILDAPIVPMEKRHFNWVMQRFSVNDLLENEEMMDLLATEFPDGLPIYSFPTRNHRIFERHLTERQNVTVLELPINGHLNLNYNIDAHQIVADTLCP